MTLLNKVYLMAHSLLLQLPDNEGEMYSINLKFVSPLS